MKEKNQIMLQCEGEVTVVSKKGAVVKIEKDQKCEKCNFCNFKYGDNKTTLTLKNELNAKPGDKVIIQAKKSNYDLWIKIMYFAPLIFLFAGLLFALKFETSLAQVVFALCVFLIGTLLSIITICVLLSLNKTQYKLLSITEVAAVVEVNNDLNTQETTQNTEEQKNNDDNPGQNLEGENNND